MTENNEVQQKEVDGEKQPQASGGANAGDEPQAVDLIERAKAAANELKAENARLELNIAKLAKLRSEQILGGGSLAGTIERSPIQKQEEEDQAFADRLMQKYYPIKKVRL